MYASDIRVYIYIIYIYYIHNYNNYIYIFRDCVYRYAITQIRYMRALFHTQTCAQFKANDVLPKVIPTYRCGRDRTTTLFALLIACQASTSSQNAII